jgi:ribose transport system ATP-binding protein
MTESVPDVVLAARGISKSFPGVKALDRVEITVRRGRLNAVLGENGAGKSTLMNILAGVFPPDEGEIVLEGRPVSFRNPREAQERGISIIFQELNLIPQLSVAENIFLGREPLNPFGLIDYRELHRRSSELLGRLQLDVTPATPLARLRVGQQQVVEIAKALSFDARVIIMDEPTSAITLQEVEVLFTLIGQLKRQGVGIVYITHKLEELPRIADDVTVMRDGRFIGAREVHAVTTDEIVRMMVGRDPSDLFQKEVGTPGDEAMRVEGISLPHPERPGDRLVDDVSFSVRRSEVLGVFGLMGAGRTELLESIFGLHPEAASGRVYVEGRPVTIRSPRQAIAAGIALAPEDRKGGGLVLSMSVEENASLASLERAERGWFLDPARERGLVGGLTDRLGVKTPSLRQPVRYLSGGNQQKVVLAKWLATNPRVLLLDEPTRGIDVNAKAEIYALIDELTRAGLAVVMVSSEMPEILAIADRILVMSEGRKTAEYHRTEATEESVMRAALPRAHNAGTGLANP